MRFFWMGDGWDIRFSGKITIEIRGEIFEIYDQKKKKIAHKSVEQDVNREKYSNLQ